MICASIFKNYKTKLTLEICSTASKVTQLHIVPPESDVKSNKPFGQASYDRVQPRIIDPTLLRVRPAMIVANKNRNAETGLISNDECWTNTLSMIDRTTKMIMPTVALILRAFYYFLVLLCLVNRYELSD